MLRLLDLELEMLSLKSQMLSQQRSAIDAERLHGSERSGIWKSSGICPELQFTTRARIGPHHRAHPEPLFPTMRPMAAAGGSVGPHAGGATCEDVVCSE
jgi:hypothetical protein